MVNIISTSGKENWSTSPIQRKRTEDPFLRLSSDEIPNLSCHMPNPALEASKENWTALSQSALQMNQCNIASYANYQPPKPAQPFQTAPKIKRGTSQHIVFVHGLKGSDLFYGTFEKPMHTVQSGLSRTHRLRATQGTQTILCMAISGAIYYLQGNATTASSQIGAIALTANDRYVMKTIKFVVAIFNQY